MDRVRTGLQIVLERVRKVDPAATLSLSSVLHVDQGTLDSASPEHVAFGCNPSLNAYGVSGEVIGDPRSLPFRFAGGHIHMGGEFPKPHVDIVKAIDRVVGVACVGMFAEFDSPLRRRFYGLAGEYRRPKHGLEYRTLSNAWLAHPALAFWVFDMCRAAKALVDLNLTTLLPSEDDTKIQSLINNCDVKGARRYAKKYESLYRFLCKEYYTNAQETGDLTMALILKGIGSVLPSPLTIESAWQLDCPTSSNRNADNPGKWVPHGDGKGVMFHSLASVLSKGK